MARFLCSFLHKGQGAMTHRGKDCGVTCMSKMQREAAQPTIIWPTQSGPHAPNFDSKVPTRQRKTDKEFVLELLCIFLFAIVANKTGENKVFWRSEEAECIQQAPSDTTTPASRDYKYYCSTCNTCLKIKSELNKHEVWHSKPFYCDAKGCNRTEGFSSKNDLDRHKRSVHSDLEVSGPRYICRLGQCAAVKEDEPKTWPRADNFRSHLRHIHQKEHSRNDDLEEYIYRLFVPDEPHRHKDLQKSKGTTLSNTSTDSESNLTPRSPPTKPAYTTRAIQSGENKILDTDIVDGIDNWYPTTSVDQPSVIIPRGGPAILSEQKIASISPIPRAKRRPLRTSAPKTEPARKRHKTSAQIEQQKDCVANIIRTRGSK
ncbi:hypothetical protein BKA56DRAFT_622095 [Ilyonectria sp. MPI-CAGE-AT-0026]|nr:hypothetical protein BKA56DRAFT_626419 [Ilyonectria sp. MPI-CAGE-AT-0026]KAH6970388.1 hypothetical protein BKA56DRAFT_622095 [Ilyonectria sp. MPI-CAGE-AT-0026]